MSRQLEIIFPVSIDMDGIRSFLHSSFSLSEKVEGLGKLEQLDVFDQEGRCIAAFEWDSVPSEESMLRRLLQERLADPETQHYFTARIVNWRMANKMLSRLLDRDRTWVYMLEYSQLISGREYASRVHDDPNWDYLSEQQ